MPLFFSTQRSIVVSPMRNHAFNKKLELFRREFLFALQKNFPEELLFLFIYSLWLSMLYIFAMVFHLIIYLYMNSIKWNRI